MTSQGFWCGSCSAGPNDVCCQDLTPEENLGRWKKTRSKLYDAYREVFGENNDNNN